MSLEERESAKTGYLAVDGSEPRAGMARRSCRVPGARPLLPGLECPGPDRAKGIRRQSVPAWMEVAIDERVCGEEVLSLLGRFESLHLPFPTSCRPM
jgi:hypothetical protein